MNMKTDRINGLIKILISEHDFMTVQQLAEQLNVSNRTVHNYMLSQKFHSTIYPATLIKKQNRGVKLDADQVLKAKIALKLKTLPSIQDTQEDDFCTLLLKLLSSSEEVAYEAIKHTLFLSASSLTALLQEIEKYVQTFACSIKHRRGRGIIIVGRESNIRKLYYAFLTTFISVKTISTINRISDQTNAILSCLLREEEKHKVIEIINLSEHIINTNYCDEDYNKLSIQLAIMVLRLQGSFYIHSEPFYDLKNSQEFYYAVLLQNYLERDFLIQFKEAETEYLSLLLLGTRKQVNIVNKKQDIDVLEKFLNLLSIRLNVELSHDFELKQNLMSHLKPAFHRMKHGISNENPLLEQIRINYTEIYIAVVSTIEDLEIMEHIYFDSNEIGYVCIHIIAAVNRPSNIKRITTALVCNEGLSIEIFLKNVIESYFSELYIKEIFRENTIQQIQFE